MESLEGVWKDLGQEVVCQVPARERQKVQKEVATQQTTRVLTGA